MVPITVIVIAQNEESNIEQCLTSVVGWAEQVFVVDSFSTDRTSELARACGAEVVQHEFVDWASQRNWTLQNLPLEGEWVFFLDADETVPDTFKATLARTGESQGGDLAGIYVRFDLYFLGCCLKRAYESPPVLRIIRRGRARWVGVGAREYCVLDGKSVKIEERLIHQDLKGLSGWIDKQNRNATREALWVFQRLGNPVQASEHTLRVWLRHNLYYRLPPLIRPFLYFLYRYILRLGFLDGVAGFAYTFLHAWWLKTLIDLKLKEMKIRTGRD